jgi:glycerol-3-phosphate acyltransferase PlsX
MAAATRIVLDLLGSDHAPKPEVGGLKLFFEKNKTSIKDVSILAVGNSTSLSLLPEVPQLKKFTATKGIPMDVQPSFALRHYQDSTVSIGLKLLQEGEGDVFVSAGNTGAILAFAVKYLKRLQGLSRPGIMVVLPEPLGNKILIDCGANADCRPEHLLGFAQIGIAASRALFQKQEPVVALLNIGEEKSKGDQLRREAYQELETLGKNFYGNVEPQAIFNLSVDVIVTDGFTGNILLKTLEGSFEFFGRYLKKTLTKGNPLESLAAFILKPLLKRSFQQFEYSTYGGALLAGLSKPVLIAHGRSNDVAIYNALNYAQKIITVHETLLKSLNIEEEATEKETSKPERKTLFD